MNKTSVAIEAIVDSITSPYLLPASNFEIFNVILLYQL